MQQPTCTNLRIRNVRDAHLIFHAARSGMLPIVTRRLDTEERRAVRPGNVYVWEERGPNSRATGLGIERWTDGIPWSASRVRDEFLFYHERHRSTDMEFYDPEHAVPGNSTHNRLVKQTYSVLVETSAGQRKWHLTAYFVPALSSQLRTVDDLAQVACLRVPDGMYTSAKVGKGRARDAWASGGGSDGEAYAPSSPTYPVYAGFGPMQHAPAPARARDVRPGFAAPVWPERVPGGASPPSFAGLPPLPAQPLRSQYLPRHPIDDAALRSLRAFP